MAGVAALFYRSILQRWRFARIHKTTWVSGYTAHDIDVTWMDAFKITRMDLSKLDFFLNKNFNPTYFTPKITIGSFLDQSPQVHTPDHNLNAYAHMEDFHVLLKY